MIRSALPFDLTNSYSNQEISKLAEIFKLLADPTRLKIVLLLNENEELHVNALCAELGQSQPAISHHLALLRGGNMIQLRRAGKFNYYRVSGEAACEQAMALLNLVFLGGEDRRDENLVLPERPQENSVVSPSGV